MEEINTCELDFRVIDEADITDELDRAIRNTLVKCYPKDADHFSHTRWWHSLPAWTVCAIYRSETVASSLSVVERCVTVGGKGRMITVAGVGNVFAQLPWRKKGVIDRVMALALAEAQRRVLDAGLLFCEPALEKVYKRMGWETIDGAVFMSDESGHCVPGPVKNITMVIPILADEFPSGDIDLNGRDW